MNPHQPSAHTVSSIPIKSPSASSSLPENQDTTSTAAPTTKPAGAPKKPAPSTANAMMMLMIHTK
ncbi:hypothetical protein MBANPS3_000062 [Mucor bainieri]